MIKRVCVFASSSDVLDDIFYKEAQELGEFIGKSGMGLVYGGSSIGMMIAAARGAKNFGSEIIGVMPEKLHNFGVSSENCDKFYLTDTMRERKQKLDELSDAVVALAGGFGTLEELSEMIVQKQLGYNDKPIVILNTKGFYNKLIEFFEEIAKEKFAKTNGENIFYVAKSPLDAIEYLKNYKHSEKEILKEDIYAKADC